MGGSTLDASINRAAADKADLRKAVLERRASMTAQERASGSARIRRRLADLEEVAEARTIIGYAAFGAEADLDALLAELAAEGRGVFLPYVDASEIGIARVADLETDLAPGYRGVREPKGIGRRPANPERCEVALVPGVAFDASGGRLGYGGGHFDRLLSRLRPGTPVIGVGFAAQLVDSVPREPHDRPINMVVTEEEVMRVVR